MFYRKVSCHVRLYYTAEFFSIVSQFGCLWLLLLCFTKLWLMPNTKYRVITKKDRLTGIQGNTTIKKLWYILNRNYIAVYHAIGCVNAPFYNPCLSWNNVHLRSVWWFRIITIFQMLFIYFCALQPRRRRLVLTCEEKIRLNWKKLAK